jgi:outer membrane protein assembly factor BamB
VVPAWNHPLDAVMMAPPAASGTRAFVPVEGDRLMAFDIQKGTSVWTSPARPLFVPATGDGLLFVAEPEAITAFRQDTGAVAWRVPFAAELAVPLVWDNGWLIAAEASGNVLAFRATDGELIWRQNLERRVHAAPALAADRVYVALGEGDVVALEVATGTRLWSRRLGGPPNDMLATDDRIYVGSDDNYLYCLMATTGEVAWRWRTGADVIGTPVTDGARVYFVSRDNVLRALDRKSGAQRWKRALPGRPTRGIVRAGDLLLVSGLTPKVSAFAMKDGSPAGDITSPGELAASPFVTTVRGVPQVVLVSRDIATGTRVLAVRRLIDPPMNNQLPVLPGAVSTTAAAPGAAPGGPAVPQPGGQAPPPGGTPPPVAPAPR